MVCGAARGAKDDRSHQLQLQPWRSQKLLLDYTKHFECLSERDGWQQYRTAVRNLKVAPRKPPQMRPPIPSPTHLNRHHQPRHLLNARHYLLNTRKLMKRRHLCSMPITRRPKPTPIAKHRITTTIRRVSKPNAHRVRSATASMKRIKL